MTNALRLVSVELIHAVILWTFLVAVIFYVLYSGLAGTVNRYTWIFIGLVVAEGLVLLVSGDLFVVNRLVIGALRCEAY